MLKLLKNPKKKNMMKIAVLTLKLIDSEKCTLLIEVFV